MTSTLQDPVALPPRPGRIESIDIFRGLTIVAMIWVNDLAHLRGIPTWLRHASESVDAMTFPDLVFPAFLFIVGMSIPIALGSRRTRGESAGRTLLHVLSRTAGLLGIGVLMVNISAINAQATGLTRAQWSVLMYLGVILAWNAYPRTAIAWRRVVFTCLRLAGAGLLIWLIAIYRGGQDGQLTWLRTQWWGILGLIGWAYLVASVSWLAFRGYNLAIAGLLAFNLVLCIADKNGALARFDCLRTINEYVSVGGHIGGHSAIVLAGTLAMLLVRESPSDRRASGPLCRLVTMGAMLFLAGLLLREPYGLSKVRVTPSWCLYCAAICCVAYAVLYWLVDVKGCSRWAVPVRAAGSNALLAYILPGIVYGLLQIVGIQLLDRHLGQGTAGIIRSTVFTGLMVVLTALLTRAHVKLRL